MSEPASDGTRWRALTTTTAEEVLSWLIEPTRDVTSVASVAGTIGSDWNSEVGLRAAYRECPALFARLGTWGGIVNWKDVRLRTSHSIT
jgi:hypothetical protein